MSPDFERRLRYGTKYRAVIDGIRGFGEDQVVKGDEIGFTIFQPTVLGSVGVEYPSDIDVLNDDRIAVANGRNGDNASNTRGLVLIDVGDPEQPVKLTEKLLFGNTLGVCAADSGIVPWFEEPVVLAVSGGQNHISSFRVMKVIGENQDGFEEAGSVLLAMDQTSLLNGCCISNVPCMAGIPRSVTLYGGDNAYIATAAIGVQGVSVKEDAIARFEEGIPGNYRSLDSLHTCGSRHSPSAVEVMRDTILSGDSNRLWLFDPDLSDGTAKYLDIPAKAVHGIPDFLSDSDGDGENEKADLVFVAGNDKTFYIVEAGSEPKVISEIGIGEYLRSMRVSPYDRVAYVGTSSGGVLIADIDDPYEGRELIDNDEDGQDDRILGKVAGTVNAEAIALGNNFGYAGDTVNGEVLVFSTNPPDAPRVEIIFCQEYDEADPETRRERRKRGGFEFGGDICYESPEYVPLGAIYSIKINSSGLESDAVVERVFLEIENIDEGAEAGLSTDGVDFTAKTEIPVGLRIAEVTDYEYCVFKGKKPGKIRLSGHVEIGIGGKTEKFSLGFESITLVDVTRVEFLEKKGDEPIKITDENKHPDQPGGLRIFPGKPTPTDSINNKVTVRATLSHKVPAGAMTVYFKSFDVNDPTGLIDANHAGSGASGTPTEGEFSAEEVLTDGDDTVETEFTVTMQPGDNFKVFASMNKELIAGLTDDTVEATTDPKGETTDETLKPLASERLTVWRRVHIELDSMGPVTGNVISGDIEHVDYPVTCIADEKIFNNCCIVTTNKTLSNSENRFKNGILRNGGNKFGVLSSTDGANFTVSLEITDSSVIPESGAFVLVDDDDFNHDDYDYSANKVNLDGDEGEDIGVPDTSLTQESDNGYENLFAYAYVRPAYDIGGNTDVAFVLNSPTDQKKEELMKTYDFENDPTKDDRYFWTVYLLGAYQPATGEDGDPDYENNSKVAVGIVDEIGKGEGASIFMETLNGEKPYFTSHQMIAFDNAHTVVHEIGHLFGGIHEDKGIMTQGEDKINRKFENITLERIRKIDHP